MNRDASPPPPPPPTTSSSTPTTTNAPSYDHAAAYAAYSAYAAYAAYAPYNYYAPPPPHQQLPRLQQILPPEYYAPPPPPAPPAAPSPPPSFTPPAVSPSIPKAKLVGVGVTVAGGGVPLPEGHPGRHRTIARPTSLVSSSALVDSVPYPAGYVPSSQKQPKPDAARQAAPASSVPAIAAAGVVSAWSSKAASSTTPSSAAGTVAAAGTTGTNTSAAAGTAAAGSSTGDAAAAEIPQKESRKRKKYSIRVAGGEVWQDPTMLEWDESDYRLFCGNLGGEVHDQHLVQIFSKYPSFLKAHVIRHSKTGMSKGYGFISFKDPEDYIKAMREMNGKYIGNRPVKLSKSNWKDRVGDASKLKESAAMMSFVSKPKK